MNLSNRFARQMAAGLIAAGALVAQQPTSHADAASAETGALDTQVRQYILDHPEVLIESLKNFQAKQKLAEEERARQAVVAEQKNLVDDPSSPVAGHAGGLTGVTIVEFFDYRCGYCKQVDATVLGLLQSNPNVRVVYKELPILGPDSMLAARASLAANKQAANLEFHKKLIATTEPITETVVERIATELKLDVAKLNADMRAPEIDEILMRNRELSEKLNVRATPTFVIGSEIVAGAVDAEGFQRLIAKDKARRDEAKREEPKTTAQLHR